MKQENLNNKIHLSRQAPTYLFTRRPTGPYYDYIFK